MGFAGLRAAFAAASIIGLGPAAGAELAAPAVSGTLYGLFHAAGDPNTCPLMAIDLATGVNRTVKASVAACAASNGVTTTWPSYSAIANGGRNLLVAITSAQYVASVDVATGATTYLGGVPSNDTLIGLVHLEAGNLTFVITQNGIWNATAPGKDAVLVKSIEGPSEALVTTAQGGGTGGAGRAFIADQNSASILVIDFGDITAEPAVLTGVSGGVGDCSYDAGSDRLVLAQGYALYSMPSDGSAKATRLGSLQDGPGYPKVNAATSLGNVWVFLDFANVHIVELTSGAPQLAIWPFTAAPRIVGFPQFVAA